MYYEDRLNRILYFGGQVPTFPPSKYKSDGTWLPSDLSLGQFAVNIVDKKIWYCAENEIVELSFTGGSGGDTTYIQNGLNTYTAGTATQPSVNISAATLDNISVSGNTVLAALSATTIFSAGTNLYSIFQPLGSGNIRKSAIDEFVWYGGFALDGSTEDSAVWTITKLITTTIGDVDSSTTVTNWKWTERNLI